MPILRKKVDLLARVEESIRQSGWSVLYETHDKHPAIYYVYQRNRGGLVKVYIWNITHGGGVKRAADEYRIQITGVTEFEPLQGARTLILGWWDDVGVFAGWDIRQHLGPLGSSPSLQVSEGALRRALLTGFAPYVKSSGETAIAFRPDFMGTYIQFLEPLHDSGRLPSEAELLEELSVSPDDVADEDIDRGVEEPRRYAVLSTKRALRALDFRRRVLSAYEHKCAMCGLQLRLVDGAHILPAAHPESTDRTANGIALCALHHRAYDRGLVTFDTLFKVHVSESMIKKLTTDDRVYGLKNFQTHLRPIILTPADKKDRPASKLVQKANVLRGWDI
ncbi:MAG: HNH endonuclease [Variibacter sp.]